MDTVEKVRCDGSHFLSTRYYLSLGRDKDNPDDVFSWKNYVPEYPQASHGRSADTVSRKEERDLFNNLYLSASQKFPYNEKRKLDYVCSCLLCESHSYSNGLPMIWDVDKIYSFCSSQAKNCFDRQELFLSKLYAHYRWWNYFLTITYDSSKFGCEEDFFKALNITFMHLSSRFGWKLMWVFERGTHGTERLHCHAIACIPDGYMVGELSKASSSFDFKHKAVKSITQNSYFLSRFGRNEFDKIFIPGNLETARCRSEWQDLFSYVSKYMGKSGERFHYSRHIPTFLYIPSSDYFGGDIPNVFVTAFEYSTIDVMDCLPSYLYSGRYFLPDDLMLRELSFVEMRL